MVGRGRLFCTRATLGDIPAQALADKEPIAAQEPWPTGVMAMTTAAIKEAAAPQSCQSALSIVGPTFPP